MGERANRGSVLADETKADSFTEFVIGHETRLRQALTAVFGVDRGKDAAAEALAHGWEHWDRVSAMENPSGYLYRVGYDKARRMNQTTVRLPAGDAHRRHGALDVVSGGERLVRPIPNAFGRWSSEKYAQEGLRQCFVTVGRQSIVGPRSEPIEVSP